MDKIDFDNPAVLEEAVMLKEHETFSLSNAQGDIRFNNDEGMGIYRCDCRFLSAYELRLNKKVPFLLSHSVDNAYLATFHLVNSLLKDGNQIIPHQSISMQRTRFLHNGLHEQIEIKNCNRDRIDIELQFNFSADFLDIIEVRHYYQLSNREPCQLKVTSTGFLFSYKGQDQLLRTTQISLYPKAELAQNGQATIRASLEPYSPYRDNTLTVSIDIIPLIGNEQAAPEPSFDASLLALKHSYDRWNSSSTRFYTDNEAIDQTLLWRNLEDLRVLCDEYSEGLVPTAGIPWYAVPFGRDSIITSIQTMGLNPDLARGTLNYLAHYQGQGIDPFREEQPGKIFHEIRYGELANLKKIPQIPSYGSIDSTPLFCNLLVKYIDWSGNLDLFDQLWNSVEQALEWMNDYGDPDNDGLVEHGSAEEIVLQGQRENRGWKDSNVSLLSESGGVPKGPIALVEVQGYVYQAKVGLARILRHIGKVELAEKLQQEADLLRTRFEEKFWLEDIGFYAQALDGKKRPVTSMTSNPGHCLWSGIVRPDRAKRIVQWLMDEDLFSGWGIRTRSKLSSHYNPMSYHNGSVWPHDNSIIAVGLRRYGFRREAERVARSVIEACMQFPDHRIPELYCGFDRDFTFSVGPAQYLSSCKPQAWGAGSLFHFFETLAGIEVNMLEHRLRIDPLETNLFGVMRVEGMRIGNGTLDFTIRYSDGPPRVEVDQKPPEVRHLEVPN
ncbi:MAG: amylo-alpha-1,6-glucosidase [Candidatus Dormibacteraceae bacterium]